MITVPQALDVLRKCPDEYAIRDLLMEAGIRGVPKDCAACPLAMWFEEVTGEVVDVMTRGVYTLYDSWDLPDVARDFVERVDDGEWPELVHTLFADTL